MMPFINHIDVLATWYNGNPDYQSPVFYTLQNAFESIFLFIFIALAVLGIIAGVALVIKGFYEMQFQTFIAFEDIGKGGLAVIFSSMFWPLYHDALKTMSILMAAMFAVMLIMVYVIISKVLNICKLPYFVILFLGLILIFKH